MAQAPLEINIEKTQTLDTMLYQILNQALATIGAEAGSLMLVDNKQGILQFKARLGLPKPRQRTERVFRIDENSVAGWVVKNKQSHLCNNVDVDPVFAPSRSSTYYRSLLSVPVLVDGKVLAVINASAAESGHFTKTHQQQLENVARQVAAPVADRVSVLEAIAEVGFELTRLPKEGSVESVLRKITEAAVRSLGADVVTLYQYIQEKNKFPIEGVGPFIAGKLRDPFHMHWKVSKGDVPWAVVHDRKPGFYSDVYQHDFLINNDNRPGDAPRLRFVEREGIKSMAALLLPFRAAEMKDEEVVGVMFANYRSPHVFTIDEIRALATFADYAAVAIHNARQRRIEQMRMVESISANFAHRMSSLAGTGRVAAQMLRERLEPADEFSLRQLGRIEQESNVLLELAERLARRFKETGKIFELTSIDITGLIEEELKQVRSNSRRIIISRDFAKNLPKVESVEFQLRQVFHDIVSNAVEAMKDQNAGELGIRTRLNRKSNQVEVEISDSGPGIPEEIRSKLFAPGVSTKKDTLGIGLWWCLTFMQATGGDVFLKDTRVGAGTTFVIKIPCVREGNAAWMESRLAAKDDADILIVDDEQNWRDVLKDSIAHERRSVKTAGNYDEALEAMEKNRFKLAILDMRLLASDPSNEDGLRLLMEMDKSDMNTKVVIVTGYGEDRHQQIASQSRRLLGFIKKSEFDVSAFRKLVHQVVA